MADDHSSGRFDVSRDGTLSLVAAVGMVAWVALEFTFRRGLGPLLADALDSGFGAEGAIMVVAVPPIAVLVAWLGTRVGIGRTGWAYDHSPRALAAGVGGIPAYFVVYLALLLALGPVLGIDPMADPGIGDVGDVPAWALALFLVGNGVVVPISEELAWRGVVQTALTESYGSYVAVVVTAVAFVTKHLVVDLAAPPARVLSLLVLAFLVCGLRARFGTASSTLAHVGINLLATASLLVA